MPSLTATPLALVYTGGGATFEPARVTGEHLRLVVTGGAASFSLGSTSLAAIDLNQLARLYNNRPIVDSNGYPLRQLQRNWQSSMEAIEAVINALTTQVNDNTALLAQIKAALDLAAAANTTANTTANAIGIANSYTSPVNTLTASSDGSITIAAHSRVYGDGTTVAVDAGSISGFTNGAYVTVYYVDAGRSGGAVTYVGTTNAVAQTGDTHIVGQATIPTAGEPPVSGGGPTAPGYTLPPSGESGDYEIP